MTSISVVSSARAAFLPSVVVNGQEWLQPKDFVETYWSEVNTVCSSTTGECNGSLLGHDITGWTWASLDDVDALFSTYLTSTFGPGPDFSALDLSDPTDYQAYASFFANFDTTSEYCSSAIYGCSYAIDGVTRTTGSGLGLFGSWSYLNSFVFGASSTVETGRTVPSGLAAGAGAWLYRTEVPGPATFWLCCAGLAALGFNRRQLTRYR